MVHEDIVMPLSRTSKVLNRVMRMARAKKMMTKLVAKPVKPLKSFAPKGVLKSKKLSVETRIIDGRPVVSIRRRDLPEANITLNVLFLHGGGYKLHALSIHWKFIVKLVMSVDALVSVIDYPLASPEVNYTHTHAMVLNAYRALHTRYEGCRTVLMGDSAGGGLALALALKLGEHQDLPSPVLNVLLSPWLDIDDTNDAEQITAREPLDSLLSRDMLSTCARLYQGGEATGTPMADPMLSPINGRLETVGRTAVITGTHDILHPSVLRMRTMTEAQGLPFSYHVYPRMPHIFMMYQNMGMPEAVHATHSVISMLQELIE
eukprot:gnl/Dysnectes_brevis/2218_a2587_1667.p1 GENE.gnl/Dysnectes_brevis/2218_a2587_1667~~gnl/Dysnectes_brevis/2218_a2587_1667.p1  ORF type:complete len:334 (+),score=90.25 gnl/Dysnectes_brevis/2218_a2587_1667:47-1003(+)